MLNQNYYTDIETLLNRQKDRKYVPINIDDRLKLLKKLRKKIKYYEKEIFNAIYNDLNKSEQESFITEYMTVLMEINLFTKNLKTWNKPYKTTNNFYFLGSKASLEFSPMGQVLIITPWNYPFQLPMMHLIAAFAAGNRIVLKPSEFTPHVSKILRTIIEEVFDETKVVVIDGDVEVTQYLLKYPFDHVHFTGSTSVGKIIMEAASKQLMKCTLELGGKSPCIIADDYNIKDVVHQLFVGKFINAGQTCIAPDFVFVSRSRKKDFEQAIQEKITGFVAEKEYKNNFVRIINEKNYDRLISYIHTAKEQGARFIVEGEQCRAQRLLTPTVISDIAPTHPLLNEEIFGPILPVVYYDNINEVVSYIQQNNKPLAIYVFSESSSFINYIKLRTGSGAFVVNSLLLHIMHPELPFGGVNHSGMGQSTGYFGFKEFSHERPVLKVNKWLNPIKFMNLPIPNRLIKFLRKIL